jgi:hypothetical protein
MLTLACQKSSLIACLVFKLRVEENFQSLSSFDRGVGIFVGEAPPLPAS